MRLVRVAAPLAALTLILAACTDDDPSPKVDPTPSTSTSTPSSPSTPEPTDVRDPEQTVRLWVSARNVTVRTGETSEVDALSASGCETCRNSIDAVAQIYEDGGHYETYGWKVVKTRVAKRSDQEVEVSAGVVFGAGKTYPSAGADPIRYDQERHIVIFRLRQGASGWLVHFIGFLS